MQIESELINLIKNHIHPSTIVFFIKMRIKNKAKIFSNRKIKMKNQKKPCLQV